MTTYHGESVISALILEHLRRVIDTRGARDIV
jgi:hypothetical protein